MNNTSERPQGDSVLEALYASRRARAETPRLASVNEQPVARAPRPEPVRPVVPLHERVHNESDGVPEPDDFSSDGVRRKVVAGVIGVAATVAVASVVALLLVNIFPKDRDADQALAATAAAQAHHVSETPRINDTKGNEPKGNELKSNEPKVNEAAKASLSQVHAPSGATEKGSSPNHEQSERLLQQFMQWRQKSPSTDKP
jgi:hypothetical protein